MESRKRNGWWSVKATGYLVLTVVLVNWLFVIIFKAPPLGFNEVALGSVILGAITVGSAAAAAEKRLTDQQTKLEGKLDVILEKLNEQKSANSVEETQTRKSEPQKEN